MITKYLTLSEFLGGNSICLEDEFANYEDGGLK
jgi:hypothetical protein